MQAYAEYKDSGVDWIGEIPAGWEVKRMKYLYLDISEKNQPNAELLSVTQSQGVIPRTWVKNRMVIPSGNLASFKFIKEGDFAISLRSFEGGLEYCHHDGIISPAYTVLKSARDDLFYGYYKFLFKSLSFISEIQMSIVGVREGKNISFEDLSYSFIPLPPLHEQTAIADFLDYKTAKIEALIGIKRRQLRYLNECKQILIQNAVTKGLNPDAPMKDSGIDWIGEIPAHWEVKRVQDYATYNDDIVDEIAYKQREIKYVDISSVNAVTNTYKFESMPFSNAPSRAKRTTKSGDTIFSTVRPYLKAVATFHNPEHNLVVSTGFAVARPKKDTNARFLGYLLRNEVFINEVSKNSVGASYPAINASDLFKIKTPFPEIETQTAIADFIDDESEKINAAIKIKENQIAKLNEYKTTLINAAVTGKIKVT